VGGYCFIARHIVAMSVWVCPSIPQYGLIYFSARPMCIV